jgi:phosphoglycerol transferase MdoB-like AlkP superfamily enzyme
MTDPAADAGKFARVRAYLRRERAASPLLVLPIVFVALGLVARETDPALHGASFMPSVAAVSVVAMVVWTLAWVLTRRAVLSFALVSGTLWLFEYAGSRKLNELGIALVPQDFAAVEDLVRNPALFLYYSELSAWPWAILATIALLAWLEPTSLPRRSVSRRSMGLVSLTLAGCLLFGTWPFKPAFDEYPTGVSAWSSSAAVAQIGDLHFFLLEHFSRASLVTPADPRVLADLDTQVSGLPANRPEEAGVPDILMVQVEAMFDPAILRTPPAELMPNLRELASRSVHGTMAVPAYAGRTTRTEFEVLTAVSLASAFPSIHYPFRGLVDRPLPSVASHLRALGYLTLAVHPYEATFYGRDRVLPRLGFDRFHALEDFRRDEIYGDYVSTEATLARMADLADQSVDAPAFVFGVTMENHGPWPRLTLPRDDSLALAIPGLDGDADDAWRSFAHHLAREDQAIAALWRRLEARGRWTVLVVYGDHLPGLDEVWERVGFADGGDAMEQRVPWLAIDNRGHLAGAAEDLDATELVPFLLARLGLPADEHFARIEGIRQLASLGVDSATVTRWRRHAGLDRYAEGRDVGAARSSAVTAEVPDWSDVTMAPLLAWGPQHVPEGLPQLDLWTKFGGDLPRGAILMVGDRVLHSFAGSATELAGQHLRDRDSEWLDQPGRYPVYLAVPADARRQRLGHLVIGQAAMEPAVWAERAVSSPLQRWGPSTLQLGDAQELNAWFVPVGPVAEGVRVKIGDHAATTIIQPNGDVTAQLSAETVTQLLRAPGAHHIWFEWPEEGVRERVASLVVAAPERVASPSACMVSEWGPTEAMLPYLRRTGEGFRLYAKVDCPTRGLALAVEGERLETQANDGLIVADVPMKRLLSGSSLAVDLIGTDDDKKRIGMLEVKE